MGSEKKNPIKVIDNLRLRKRGTFDYKAVHNKIHDFLLKMGYTFAETKHAEKSKDSGREIESEWSAYRKVTSYVKFKVDVSVFLKDYREMVVEEGSRKVRTGVGRIEITFNAYMEKNYNKLFSERKGELTNFLKELYEKYLMVKTLKAYEGKLEAEALALYEGVKELIE